MCRYHYYWVPPALPLALWMGNGHVHMDGSCAEFSAAQFSLPLAWVPLLTWLNIPFILGSTVPHIIHFLFVRRCFQYSMRNSRESLVGSLFSRILLCLAPHQTLVIGRFLCYSMTRAAVCCSLCCSVLQCVLQRAVFLHDASLF